MPGQTDEQSSLLVGVDVGGTFTDLVALDPASGALKVIKLPSSPPAFHEAVIEAVNRVLSTGNWQLTTGNSLRVVHGSTVATNALLQRAGEPVAFITTEGFRDMLLIGRQNRPRLYALNVERPRPITPQENWFTVNERIDPQGRIIHPLHDDDIDRVVAAIRQSGLKHVAVCLLFSFVNPMHEKRLGNRLSDAGLTVSLSSDILPEFREYERASTTAINASLRPTVESYLNQLAAGLAAPPGATRVAQPPSGGEASTPAVSPAGATPASRSTRSVESPHPFPGNIELRITQSAGGTLDPQEAARFAAKLVLSGPAGGVMGAAFVARCATNLIASRPTSPGGKTGVTPPHENPAISDVITYDMGGTSTDVATVLDNRPSWTTSSTIDGLPIGLPMYDIRTVGAGGGSVAYIDAGRALRVGPRSAGARPGPACYARGGTEPTVTDANLLLGRILPDQFLGGAMKIDEHLARQAIEPLARAINKSLTDTALGILKITEANMTNAVRAVTARRGHDPRKFTLVCFGGAGPLHACALADGLEIPRVLVPPYAGVLSALGMVVAPPVVDVSRTVVHLGASLTDTELEAEYLKLATQASHALPDHATRTTEYFADVRFRGQSHEIKIPLEALILPAISRRFYDAYRKRYGRPPKGRAIELVTLRVRRTGHAPRVELPAIEQPLSQHGIAREAQTIDATGKTIRAAVLTRGELLQLARTPGPLILIDPEATTFVPAGWVAESDARGIVLLSRAR